MTDTTAATATANAAQTVASNIIDPDELSDCDSDVEITYAQTPKDRLKALRMSEASITRFVNLCASCAGPNWPHVGWRKNATTSALAAYRGQPQLLEAWMVSHVEDYMRKATCKIGRSSAALYLPEATIWRYGSRWPKARGPR